jgi:tetratricopeptide (TPR) repeat protein
VTASSLAVGILLLVSPQAGSRAATPLASRAVAPAPAVGPTFEELWASYVKADAAGDAERASAALGELRRTRIERNVWTLDTVGLALVERGVARLDESRREDAEEAFRTAVALAPGLPDGHAGLAVALLKKGPFGVVPSIDAAFSAVAAFLPTGRGDSRARDLATVAGLVAAFGFAWAVAAALLVRHGGLLRHDMEEWLGPARSRSAALALLLLALLLPVATFQGWGWLPLWWLALLFAYFDGRERALALLVLGTTLAVGPLLWSLEFSLRTARNPLYSAALAAIESVPAPPEIGRLAEAARKDPEDRDLAYLLGAARRRAGRYEEAAEVYRRLLAADPGDPVARNNLANIEFVRGGYEAARAGYKAGTGPGAAPEVAATSYYNLSLVHLQKFEYQAYNEAKSNADRLAPGLVADYEQWKYDTGDYAVVDLGLTLEEVREKFAGSEVGVPHRNVAGTGAKAASRAGALVVSLLNRFTASLAVLALCALLVRRWRGPKAFTLHCGRCGTPFCRLCHLGQVSGGLCSQCYHLFVVRDGVSGPARNRKMGEVQGAEGRRDRVFRVLSVLSPGTGQIYGGWALRGAVLVAAWYGILGLLAAGRVVPLTEVPWRLSPPWLPAAAVLALLVVWGIANRFRPERESGLPARPPGPRRARPAPVAG